MRQIEQTDTRNRYDVVQVEGGRVTGVWLAGFVDAEVTGRYLNHFERGELSAYAPRLRRSAVKREEGA